MVGIKRFERPTPDSTFVHVFDIYLQKKFPFFFMKMNQLRGQNHVLIS